jgi:uncharacterized Fe-S radical SAM superfamily protein PflX
MSQYVPMANAKQYEEINRKIKWYSQKIEVTIWYDWKRGGVVV